MTITGSARWVLVAAVGAFAGGCGGDDDGDATSMSSTVGSTASESGSGGSEGAESSSGTPGSEASTAPAESSSDGGPTSDSSETTGAGDGRCMPDNAPFMVAGTGFPQASIGFDFGAQTCSVKGLMSQNPQIVIDVQESGLLDATAFGLEITDSSPEGLDFQDPPMGDSQVIDFSPGVNMTFEATTIPDGVPVIIEFRVDPSGPALRDVSAVFG